MEKFSVVIPVYNAVKTLPDCLAAVTGQTYSPLEIIFVDNNSTDGSAELIRKYSDSRIRCLSEPKQGPASARNAGIRAAKGGVIAFTDADCVPDQNWLEQMAQTFKANSCAAVAGSLGGFRPRNAVEKFLSCFTMKTAPTFEMHSKWTLSSGGFPTANLAVRRESLEKIGGFDEQIPFYSEDYDLCARLYESGEKIAYNPQVRVQHQHRGSLAGLWKQSFGFGKGHAVLLSRYFQRKIFVELPGWNWESGRLPGKVWLNLASADKKFGALFFAGCFYPPLFVLLLLYLVYLYWDVSRRLQREALAATGLQKAAMVFLLIAKSFAMTCGGLIGSWRYRVICL